MFRDVTPSESDLIRRAIKTNNIPYFPIVGSKRVKTKSAMARQTAPIMDGSFDPTLSEILPEIGPTKTIKRVGTSMIIPARSVL